MRSIARLDVGVLPITLLPAALLLLTLPLRVTGQESSSTSAQPKATPADTQTAVLALSEGDSLLVLDSLTRSGNHLEVRTNSVGRARFLIEATLTPGAAVSEARVRVWPAGQDEPQVDMVAALEGDTLRVGGAGSEERERRSVPKHTLIYVPPAPSFVEQAARRARALRSGRDSVPFTLWSPYRGGRTLPVVARFPHADSVELSFDDATYSLAVDSAGNLLGGRLAPLGHTIARE